MYASWLCRQKGPKVLCHCLGNQKNLIYATQNSDFDIFLVSPCWIH